MVQAVREDPAHGSGEFVYLMTDLEQVEIVVRRDQVGQTQEVSGPVLNVIELTTVHPALHGGLAHAQGLVRRRKI